MRNLGANLHADTTYLRATSDADGQPLIGNRSYSIRFTDGQLPPVNAFWSITLYKSNGTFADNSLGRHAIRHPDARGKYRRWLDHDSSSAYVARQKSANRIGSPTPSDSFNWSFRLYWPSKACSRVSGARR